MRFYSKDEDRTVRVGEPYTIARKLVDRPYMTGQELVLLDAADNTLREFFVHDEEGDDVCVETREPQFSNHYRCEECCVSWEDTWSCGCDDECPQCGKDFSPYDSYRLDADGSPVKEEA